MNKKKLLPVLAAVTVLIVILFFIFKPKKDACDYSYSLEVPVDIFMGPVTAKDSNSAKIFPNWYKCNKAQREELVSYRVGNSNEVLTRVIAAAPGDEISIRPDPLNRGWNLLVNGEVRYTAETPYVFGVSGVRTTLDLYLDASKKRVLGEREIVLFAIAGPGYNDSGIFGIYDVGTLGGKLEFPAETAAATRALVSFVAPEKETLKTAAGSLPPSGTPTREAAKPAAKPKPVPKKKTR